METPSVLPWPMLPRWLQGNPGTNNPCPTGYRVPTLDEWFAENLGGLQQAFIQLKITTGGVRNFNDGDFAFTTNDGRCIKN